MKDPDGFTSGRQANPQTAMLLADEVRTTDVLVIGSGIAGLSAALGLAPRQVTLLTKTELTHGGSSSWAQGGVAAAMSSEDSPAEHAADTHVAGAGLCAGRAVDILTTEGPRRVRQLIELGADFDRGPQGKLLLGREGAHGRRRILHANGDATGTEMVRALVEAVDRQETITVIEYSFALELVLRGERVVGVLALEADGRTILYRAAAVVLATGGLGQLYARTTNPAAVTGDGIAMAARAGARLADLEMVQFHPTALCPESSPDVEAETPISLSLVTEALRGEGAILVNKSGERFMLDVHPLAELAPRDIVARAIWRQQREGEAVFLDARSAVGDRFPDRFPTVFRLCQAEGIDPRVELIPVSPAAHYFMGGVATDVDGRTSLPGLWACGEVTSTGVHGANRLASNSLLEGLVYGARVAEDIARHGVPDPARFVEIERIWRDRSATLPDPSERDQIRRLMWENVGLERDRTSLGQVLETLLDWTHKAENEPLNSSPEEVFRRLETANLLTLARLVSAAALAREESRGVHYRADFPQPDAAWRERLFWTYVPEQPFPLHPAPVSREALEEIA